MSALVISRVISIINNPIVIVFKNGYSNPYLETLVRNQDNLNFKSCRSSVSDLIEGASPNFTSNIKRINELLCS